MPSVKITLKFDPLIVTENLGVNYGGIPYTAQIPSVKLTLFLEIHICTIPLFCALASRQVKLHNLRPFLTVLRGRSCGPSTTTKREFCAPYGPFFCA